MLNTHGEILGISSTHFFLVYLMTSSHLHTLCSIDNDSDDEVGKMWKGSVMVYFNPLHLNLNHYLLCLQQPFKTCTVVVLQQLLLYSCGFLNLMAK
jgi:hypothetical protein